MGGNHAMDRPQHYPAKYLEGIRLFNDGEFFACHDAWEDVWTETVGEKKAFYQGLIHAAVSLFHFENGNLGGARKMHFSSLKYLEPYGKTFEGIDVETLMAELWHCFRELREATDPSADIQLDPARVPQISLPDADNDD